MTDPCTVTPDGGGGRDGDTQQGIHAVLEREPRIKLCCRESKALARSKNTHTTLPLSKVSIVPNSSGRKNRLLCRAMHEVKSHTDDWRGGLVTADSPLAHCVPTAPVPWEY